MTTTPQVLFVCVRNGGKSQMAAGLMRKAAGDRITAHSAGTHPGPAINALSAEVLAEVGADMNNGVPRPIDPALLRTVDLVVTLGREAVVDVPPGVELRNWDTDEPSGRGIDGIERMRLVRDDISTRVQALVQELAGQLRPSQGTGSVGTPAASQWMRSRSSCGARANSRSAASRFCRKWAHPS